MALCFFLRAGTVSRGPCGGHVPLGGKEKLQLRRSAGHWPIVSTLEVTGRCHLRLKHQMKERDTNSEIDF